MNIYHVLMKQILPIFLFLFIIETRSFSVALTVCRLGWPQTHRDSPASRVLALKANAIIGWFCLLLFERLLLCACVCMHALTPKDTRREQTSDILKLDLQAVVKHLIWGA